ncbi:MAG: methyltransferase domain-containing protein [Terracidiphilus sp.]
MSRPVEASEDRSERVRQNVRAFDLLSRSYDAQFNPLLTLEQRYLKRMLPKIAGRDVLDAGCGSGRWLRYMAGMRPRSLTGLDTSAAMLQVAEQKRMPGVELLRCSCEEIPIAHDSFDLINSSFVLSYIDDVHRAAAEISRIARSGCDLFLSDMHPETQHQLGWKRSFRDKTTEIGLEPFRRGVGEVMTVFCGFGWEVCAAIEPEFGASEREIFEATGQLNRFLEAERHPAIYILHLRKRDSAGCNLRHEDRVILKGARCALGARECARASIRIARGQVAQLVSDGFSSFGCEDAGAEIDLTGYLLMPGLINAHDHLEFALFPRLANSRYRNATEWAEDIQKTFANEIAMHRSVAKDVRLWWGAVRNLLCGVTTVCHHNAAEAELSREDFPVRVVADCGWAHSLAFGGDLRAERAATPERRPFIVHACEGVDRTAREELWQLDRLNVLDDDCVIVHGLAIDDEGAALLRRRGASMIICPSSNGYLFGQIPDIRLLDGIGKVALGSDSPLTADGDLLDEIRFAIHFCGASPEAAYRMVTEAPASILRLSNGEGSIRALGRADLIAIRDTNCDASDRLRDLSAADVELVLIGGRVQLASDSMMDRLPAFTTEGLEPLSIDDTIRWLRAPIRRLLSKAEAVLGAGAVRLGGKPIHRPARAEAGYGR